MPAEGRTHPTRGQHRATVAALAATVLTAVVVAGLATARFAHPATPRTATIQTAGRQPDPSTVPTTTGGPAPEQPSSRPVVSHIETSGSLLIIPALNVRAPVTPTGAVGFPETASLTIPADVHTVGWWDGTVQDGDRIVHEDAPAPGQPGVALIAGHVDSAAEGPGALHDLANLKVGDTIEISNSAGPFNTWTVYAPPQIHLKTALPAALWVTTGAPKLALVTCGGPFDAATGHYQDNVIVWAGQPH